MIFYFIGMGGGLSAAKQLEDDPIPIPRRRLGMNRSACKK